jgi:serine/threonine-protein kinase
LPIDDAVAIAREVADALHYAHAQHVVHRDIKPENILLQSGHALLADFGIALAVTSAGGPRLTQTGLSLGTPVYMSPEQAMGEPMLDARTDIYALGAVTYEMLTGEPPFTGATMQAVVAKIVSAEPARPSLTRKALPHGVETAVLKALAKLPADRFSNAAAFGDALKSSATNARETRAHAPRTPLDWRGPTVGLVIAAIAAAAWFTTRQRAMPAAVEDRSVAVLPFQNASADSTQEYFSDGLTDELISRLATTGLRVSGRNSVFTFKGKSPAATTVGAALRVGTVLTGNVRRLGDRLHVSAELASAKNDSVLWTFNVDRQTRDVFAVQRDIVDAILVHFRLAGTTARVDETKSLEAHDYYLKGRFLAIKGTREALLESLEEFKRALAVDSNYARAYTGIAYSWGWLSDGYLAPTEAIPKALDAVRHALQLDSTLAEAWSAAANLTVQYDWDWPRARREVDRALSINRNDPDAWLADSYVWIAQGNRTQAMQSLERGQTSDPLSSIIALQRMFHLAWSDHPDSAVRFYNASVLRPLNFEYGDSFLGVAQMKLGQYAVAESTFKRAETMLGHRAPGLGVLYARMGKPDAALGVLRDIDAHWPATYIPPEMVAQIPAALGDTTGMYRWLERGLKVRSAWATLLGVWDPVLAAHRNEAHYQDIMRRVGIVAPR